MITKPYMQHYPSRYLFFLVAMIGFAIPNFGTAQPLPQAVTNDAGNVVVARTIIGLYDGREFASPEESLLHRALELPLNHLGLKLEVHDVRKPLPDIHLRSDVRGVISWYLSPHPVDDLVAYVRWLESVVKADKKLVIIGVSGVRL